MSTKQYLHYTQSDAAWIGQIPSHWLVKPLLSVSTQRRESNLSQAEKNLLSLSYGRIVAKDIDSNDGLLPESFETYQVVRLGDVVLRLTDLQNDKNSLRTAIVRQTGIITSAYICLTPTAILPEYFSYLLRSYDLTKVFYSMGGGIRQSMRFADIRRLPILVPSQAEQKAIADFLDQETSKINALIAAQRRLLSLLSEKRRTLISHTVTHGLDDEAPTQGSGHPWLERVPAHWEIKPLKQALRLITEKAVSRTNPLALENVEGWSGKLVSTESEFAGEGTRFEEGDILFGKLRPYLAKVYLAESAGEAVGEFFVLRAGDGLNARFAQYQLLSRTFIEFVSSAVFGSKMPRVSWKFLSKMPFVVPHCGASGYG